MTHSSNDDYIIHSSDETSYLRRMRDIVLTLVLWVLYFYFIWDCLTYVRHIITWWSQGPSAKLTHDIKLFHVLMNYCEVVICMGAALIGWALYNLIRFRGRTRRKSAPAVSIEDLSHLYQFTPKDIGAWQQERVLVMHHDKYGKLIGVDIPD